MIVMEGKRGVTQIPSFMDLPERSGGLDIIFAWSSPRQATYEEIIENIRLTANNILHGNEFLKSAFRSLGEISGSIWQESMRAKDVIVETDIIIEETDITNSTPMTKRRKSAIVLGDKMLSKYGKQISELVTSTFCIDENDDADLYIAAASEFNFVSANFVITSELHANLLLQTSKLRAYPILLWLVSGYESNNLNVTFFEDAN